MKENAVIEPQRLIDPALRNRPVCEHRSHVQSACVAQGESYKDNGKGPQINKVHASVSHAANINVRLTCDAGDGDDGQGEGDQLLTRAGHGGEDGGGPLDRHSIKPNTGPARPPQAGHQWP